MTNHVLPPIGGGGSGGRESVTVSGSPFADLTALETWSQANPSELLNNDTQVAVAQVGTSPNFIVYEWIGADGVYSADSWANMSGLTGEQTAAVQSIIDLDDNSIPIGMSGALTESDGIQDSSGWDIQGRVRANDLESDRDSIDVGDILRLSEDGGIIRQVDTTLLQSFYAATSQENADRSTTKAARIARTAETEVTLQPDKSENQAGNYSFQAPVTFNRNITEITIEMAQNVDNVRITFRENNSSGPILWESHTDQVWEAGGGYTFVADTETQLDLIDSARVDTTIPLFVTIERFTNPSQMVVKGATIMGQFLPFLRQKYTIQTRVELADASEITQPLGYATINNFERINNNWESFGNVQLDNTESQVNEIEIVALKVQNNASNHDFRIVYGGTNAAHAGEIYYTGNLTASASGAYLITMTATATAIPSETDVVLESQGMAVSGSRVDHQSTMIKYQERS